MSDIPLSDTFQFDAQGFVILRGVLSPDECARYREELERLYAQEYPDPWRATYKGQQTLQLSPGQRRLNGLPLWSTVFDPVIDQPQVLARMTRSHTHTDERGDSHGKEGSQGREEEGREEAVSAVPVHRGGVQVRAPVFLYRYCTPSHTRTRRTTSHCRSCSTISIPLTTCPMTV